MRAAAAAGVLASIIAGVAPGLAAAQAEPTCRPSEGGPTEYQAALSPFMGEAAPVPPFGSAPPGATTGGATTAAREALGDQFTLLSDGDTLPGWVVGVAPGPLDLQQARAAIVDRLSARFTPDDVAFLDSRLHLDPQLYGEPQLKAAQAAITADLAGRDRAPAGRCSSAFELSDAIGVTVKLSQDGAPEIGERMRALVPYGDIVRLGVSSGGPFVVTQLPLTGMPIPAMNPLPGQAGPVTVRKYVSWARASRCVRGSQINIAVRRDQLAGVGLLTVRANGRRRTIGGARLRKPITVALTRRRTSVVVSVKLRTGQRGERTVAFTRCG